MHVETFEYKCGCIGEMKTLYENYLTRREKEELRRNSRSQCPDCYRQKQEDAFVARWGSLPSVSGISSKQEAYGFKVLFRLLSSGGVRDSLGKFILSQVDLPVGALLDVYNGIIAGTVQAFPGMTGTENILLTAYPDLRRNYFAACRAAAQMRANKPTQEASSEVPEPTE